jgi:hypothetical protein
MFKPVFTPSNWNVKDDFSGTVEYVGGGYSKILLNGYCEVNCASSKVNGIVLKRKTLVTVDLRFNMRGPIAFIVSL